MKLSYFSQRGRLFSGILPILILSLGATAALADNQEAPSTQDEIYVKDLTGAFQKSIALQKFDPIAREKGDVDYVNDNVMYTILFGKNQTMTFPRGELVKTLYSSILPRSDWQRDYLRAAPSIMKNNVWEDLGLIATNATRPDQSLVNLLAQPQTILGQMQMGVLLVTPTNDVPELLRRQKVLSHLSSDGGETRRRLIKSFNKNSKPVQNFVQFWSSFDAYSEKNSALFRTRSPFAIFGNGAYAVEAVATLNKSSVLISLGALSRLDARPGHGAANANAVVLALFGIYRHFVGTVPQQRLASAIKERLRSVRDVVRLARRVRDFVQDDPVLAREMIYEMGPIHQFFAKDGDADIQMILKNLESSSLQSDSIFSRYGIAVETILMLVNHKDKFSDLLMALGRVDAYLAVADRFAHHATLPLAGRNSSADAAHLSFAEYETNAENPHVALTGFWSPFLAPDVAIVNNIELGGGANIPRIGIFSGPNAGGKSTMMKAVGYNVLLAQTFGISFSASMKFTPFANITTYMNITDDVLLGQSLFKAEVTRTKKYLDTLDDLKPQEFSFSILDEMFSGTNPKEGAAAAYSAIHHIGSYPGVLGMVATHYHQVTHIAERVKETGIFRSFHVELHDDEEGTPTPDFKLYEGSTDQGGALLILKKEGFAPEILDEALAILEQ